MQLEEIKACLKTRNQTEEAVRYLIEKAVADVAAESNGDGVEEVFAHWLNTFYPTAVANVYRFAGSPIEIIFLNALIFSFLIWDPLGLFITAPHSDVCRSLANHSRPLRRMLQIDSEMGNVPGEPQGFLKRLASEVRAGSVSAKKAERLKLTYIAHHGLGIWNAFYVTPQAGFPLLKISGRSIRTDLFVCVPSTPSFRFIVECDGYEYHSSRASFTNDRQRDRLLQEHGLLTRRYSGSELCNRPVETSIDLFKYMHEQYEREQECEA
jgi:hypothetical protein